MKDSLGFSRAVLAALAVVLVLTASSFAGEFTAFGPQDFVRTSGRPTIIATKFTVLDAGAPYTLRIANGSQAGRRERVSSAVIWLNGVQLLGPDRFNKDVSEIVLPVSLLSENELLVELRSQPGSGFTLQIIGIDNVPPTITALVSPQANTEGWHNTDPTVTFLCSDATSGIAVCPSPVVLSVEGSGQVITGTAVDRAGNSASVSVVLNLDKTPPSIFDFLPADGGALPEPEVNLTGLVRDTISGHSALTCSTGVVSEEGQLGDEAIGEDFAFACTLPLQPGANLVAVHATDAAGNSSSATLTLHHVLRPRVVIESPANLQFFVFSPVNVTGTVDDPSAVVMVNDVPATVANGVFQAAVPMPSGIHTITASAQNIGGTGTDSVDVFVAFGTVPTLKILSPEPEFVLGANQSRSVPVRVEGWVRDNRLIPVGEPDVAVVFNGAPVSATLTKGAVAQCLSALHCWRFSAEQVFPPPTGTPLAIQVNVVTGGGTASRQVSGIVDFCGGGQQCNVASLFQGCEQNRRCIPNSDGCSNPVFPGRKENPVQGKWGLTSTAFGLDEGQLPADDVRRQDTVFGQKRPVQLPCNRHDECYHQRCPQAQTRDGVVADKRACDARFLNDLIAVCTKAYPEAVCPAGRIGLLNCPAWRVEKTACHAWARTYHVAVSLYTTSFAFPLIAPEIELKHCVGCPTIE